MTINYLRLEPDTAATAVIAKTQQIVSIETLPFDEWARGAVYSNLKETIGPPQQTAIPSFNDWAGGVVFNGIDLTIKAVVEANIKISTSFDDKRVQQDEEEEAPDAGISWNMIKCHPLQQQHKCHCHNTTNRNISRLKMQI